MNKKQLVQEWKNKGSNYLDGCSLLLMIDPKNRFHGFLKGSPDFKDRRNKLEYELKKASGITVLKALKPERNQAVNQPPTTRAPRQFMRKESHSDQMIDIMNAERKPQKPKPGDVAPAVIQDCKNLYSSLYKERSILHQQRTELGFDNTAGLVEKRKTLTEQITDLSGKMELLYETISTWENTGRLPENNISSSLICANDEPLPNSVDELKKLKKNLQTNNTKDRNRLNYQTARSKQRKTPMPDGPKKVKIENRIADREKKISDINEKLNKINAG